jgi:hypothetical protein
MSEDLNRRRIGTHLHPRLVEILEAECSRRGLALNELLTELCCKSLGLDPERFAVPRKTPGRKRAASTEPEPSPPPPTSSKTDAGQGGARKRKRIQDQEEAKMKKPN